MRPLHCARGRWWAAPALVVALASACGGGLPRASTTGSAGAGGSPATTAPATTAPPTTAPASTSPATTTPATTSPATTAPAAGAPGGTPVGPGPSAFNLSASPCASVPGSGSGSVGTPAGAVTFGPGAVSISTPGAAVTVPGCFTGPDCAVSVAVTAAGQTVQVGAAGQQCGFDAAQWPVVHVAGLDDPSLQVQRGPGGVVISVAGDVLFDFDRAAIRPDAAAKLAEVGRALRAQWPGRPLDLRGHTDSVGSAGYNQVLSLQRAQAVGSWLVANAGIPAGLVTAVGLGSTVPVAPNTRPDGTDDPAGRALNRRVEIVVATS